MRDGQILHQNAVQHKTSRNIYFGANWANWCAKHN